MLGSVCALSFHTQIFFTKQDIFGSLKGGCTFVNQFGAFRFITMLSLYGTLQFN